MSPLNDVKLLTVNDVAATLAEPLLKFRGPGKRMSKTAEVRLNRLSYYNYELAELTEADKFGVERPLRGSLTDALREQLNFDELTLEDIRVRINTETGYAHFYLAIKWK